MSFTLAEAFVDLGVVGMANVTGAVGKVKGMLGGLSTSGLAALGLGASIGAIGGIALKAFAESEAAEQGLRAALKATGQEVDGNMEKFSNLANALQSVTTQDDEATLAIIKTGLEMGLSAEDAEKFTKAAVGLAGTGLVSAEDAMVGLTKEANGMKNTLAKTFPQLAECANQSERMAMISELASQGMEQQFASAETLGGTFEHLKQIVSNLMETLGGALAPAFETVMGVVGGFVDYLGQLIGAIQDTGAQSDAQFSFIGDTMTWLSNTVGQAVSFMKTWIENIIVAIMNWKTLVAIAGNSIALAFSRIMDTMGMLWENTKIGLSWFGEHWREVFTDIGNYTIEVMKDIGQNLVAAWEWAISKITGEKTKTQFKAIGQDFKSAITKGPEFVSTKKSAMTVGLEENGAELSATFQKQFEKTGEEFQANMAKHAKPAIADIKKDMANIGDLDIQKDKKGKEKKEKDLGMLSALDVWKKAQGDILKNESKTPEAQLAEAKKGNEHNKEMVTTLKDISSKLQVAS